MRCPACARELTRRTAGGLEVEVCEGGCGGIWFDNHELQKVDERHEHRGEELLRVGRDADVEVDHARPRSCPKCEDMPLMRHFWTVKQDVEVDECPECGGTWLDTGELGAIRTAFPTEEARREAARARFDELFGGQLEAMREESEDKMWKARRFSLMFRYLCPSWYVPGKQDWGAF